VQQRPSTNSRQNSASDVDGSTPWSPQHLEGKKQAKSAKSSKYDQ